VGKNDYVDRVRAYNRALSAKERKEGRGSYREKDMKVGMPLGCWLWIVASIIVAAVSFKACCL
jgi:hypothetical protein